MLKLERYEKASTLKEAYDWIQDEENILLGGGGWLKLTHVNKKIGVDLEELNLDYIREQEDGFHIGAMTTLRTLETDASLQKFASGMIAGCASKIMGVTVRNVVTVGGSICGKYGFSDLVTTLLSLETKLVFYHNRTMDLGAFLEHKGKIKDILVEIIIPKDDAKGYFEAYKKTGLDFSLVNVAVLHRNGLNICVGSRPGGPVLIQIPLHSTMYGALLLAFEKGKLSVDSDEIESITKEFTFGTNHRASKDYRFELAKVLIMHGIKEVLA